MTTVKPFTSECGDIWKTGTSSLTSTDVSWIWMTRSAADSSVRCVAPPIELTANHRSPSLSKPSRQAVSADTPRNRCSFHRITLCCIWRVCIGAYSEKYSLGDIVWLSSHHCNLGRPASISYFTLDPISFTRDTRQNVEKCPISQCRRVFQHIPGFWFGRGWA